MIGYGEAGKHYASFGKAREFAGLNKYKFSLLLGENKIPRHYEEPDLADDIEYARNNK